MTNLEALKALYVACGGAEADVAKATTSAEIIAKLNEVSGGSYFDTTTYFDGNAVAEEVQ